MAGNSSNSIIFKRAVALTLTIIVCRQLGNLWTPLSLILPSNILTETADAIISFTNAITTIFFAWHIAGPSTTQFSYISPANLRVSSSFLVGVILVLTACSDSWIKKALLCLVTGACWFLGWNVTTVEQRKSCWQFVKQGLVFKLFELWQKIRD